MSTISRVKRTFHGFARVGDLFHAYPLTALGVLFAIGTVLILGHVLYLSNRINQEMAKEYAALYLRSLDKFRTMYSSQIVNRVEPRGIQVMPDYHQHEGAIPFPATLSIELAAAISDTQRGIKARLYSEAPFPWRQDGGIHDDFEQQAWNALVQAPQQTFSRFEKVRGKWSLRAAQAVVLEESCIGCHNGRGDSPRHNWKVGDVRGVQEVTIPLHIDWATTVRSGIGETLAFMLLITLLGLGILALVLNKLRSSLHLLGYTNMSLERFVPHDFLRFLQKDSIVDVALGDNVQQEMTVLFADIRSFTSLSENMTPEENFQFINHYFSQMGPIIRQHGGFIDKYIGDEIMALFQQADDALDAAIAMLHKLEELNRERRASGQPPLRIGIGLNTGMLMLGTIGEQHRMEGTVISDAVNLASRVEGMTKMYGASLLISEHTLQRLHAPERYLLHVIDRVKVKGKTRAVTVYGVFDGESPAVQACKRAIRGRFEQGVHLYQRQRFADAKQLFESCLRTFPEDVAAALYRKRCEHNLLYGWDVAWDGVMQLEYK